VLSFFASAQLDTRRLQVGFGGGVNYLFVTPKMQSGSQSSVTGFNAGLITNYTVSKRFSVSTRLSFVKEGWKYKDDRIFQDSSGTPEASLVATNSYSWLSMPIHLNYFFRPEMPTSFFVGLGCSPRRSLSSGTKIETHRVGTVNGAESGSSINFSNDWNFLASFQAGVQFSLPRGGKVLTTLTYERGLTDLNKKQELPANSVTATYNYGYQPSHSLKINSLSIGISYIY
jgi:hypothetical protein